MVTGGESETLAAGGAGGEGGTRLVVRGGPLGGRGGVSSTKDKFHFFGGEKKKLIAKEGSTPIGDFWGGESDRSQVRRACVRLAAKINFICSKTHSARVGVGTSKPSKKKKKRVEGRKEWVDRA